MVKILFHSSFQRAFRRRVRRGSQRDARFRDKLSAFMRDPFNPTLKTHRLKGRLKDYWSFSVEYDLRVIFYFENEGTAVLIDIGSHNDVY